MHSGQAFDASSDLGDHGFQRLLAKYFYVYLKVIIMSIDVHKIQKSEFCSTMSLNNKGFHDSKVNAQIFAYQSLCE